MKRIRIEQLGDGKFELYIDGKLACRGNIKAIETVINSNLGAFGKKFDEKVYEE